METIKFRWLALETDLRNSSDIDYPLMSVSQTKGVIPRSELMGKEGRAESLENYKVCLPGEIVINRMSAASGALGLASQGGLVSPDYAILKPTKLVTPKYLEYLMRSSWFIGEMVARLKGIGVGGESASVRTPRINISDLGDVVVSLPTIDKQVKTTGFLDEKVSSINRALESNKHLLDLSEEVLLSKIYELFEVKPSPDYLLGKFGESISLFRAGVRGQAGQTPKSSEPNFWTSSGSGTPWLSIGDMVSRGFVEVSEKDVTKLGLSEIGLTPNSSEVLLFAMYASMGKVSFARAGFVWSQAILGLTTNELNKYFLAAWLEIAKPSLKALARSSTQDNLNAEQVMSLRIPVVKRMEQVKIGTKYLDLLEEHSNRISFLTRQSELLNELKSSLITSAVTDGKFIDGMASDKND